MHYKMKANPLHGAASMNGQKRSKSSKPLRTWTPFLRFQIATGRPSLQSLDLVIQSHDIHFKSIGSMDFFKKPSHLCLLPSPQKNLASPFHCKADGCTRVGIHPMAFLGRTARLREFKFQDNLQVGEHEQHLGRRNIEIWGGGTLKLVWPWSVELDQGVSAAKISRDIGREKLSR